MREDRWVERASIAFVIVVFIYVILSMIERR
jgi:hypothetical protein